MRERCRDWEHDLYDCVFNCDAIPEEADVCMCGVGEVSNDLDDERWAKLAPILIRNAIGPIFATPSVEETRGSVEQELRRIMRKSKHTINDRKQ